MNPEMSTEQLYVSFRPLLFSLAYRMLGSVADAEDIVHETFLSLSQSRLEQIHNMKSYLCRMVTNRCIDLLRSSQKQREIYVGPWLPEPLLTEADEAADPSQSYETRESLSTAYLLLLQQLSWTERAVFLLREVLQFEYDEIADIVGKSSTNCRQIFHRAKRAIGRSGSSADETKVTLGVIHQFVDALATGNIPKILESLAQDATLYSDGGGKVTAAIRPIVGAENISRFFAGVLPKMPPGFTYRMTFINGEPGVITYLNGVPSSVFSFHVDEGNISAMYIVVNPDKLQHVK